MDWQTLFLVYILIANLYLIYRVLKDGIDSEIEIEGFPAFFFAPIYLIEIAFLVSIALVFMFMFSFISVVFDEIRNRGK